MQISDKGEVNNRDMKMTENIRESTEKNMQEKSVENTEIEMETPDDKAEFYRRRKMSYSIRLLCAVYLSYLVYSLASGISETAGTERIIIIFFMVFFAVFDIWCYISGFKGLKKLKEMQ